jgi:predicted phage gp36 major capsid-like protein
METETFEIEALRHWLAGQHVADGAERRIAAKFSPKPTGTLPLPRTRALRRLKEARQQGVGVDADGGVLVAEAFSNELAIRLLDASAMMDVSRVISQPTGAPLVWPTLDDVANLGVLQGENAFEPAAVRSTGTFTITVNLLNTETITIGSTVYTWQTVLTDVDGNVLIGATASDSLNNVIAHINGAAGAGTLYAASGTAHPTHRAVRGAGLTMIVTAIDIGAAGDVATLEAIVSAGAVWGAATTLGGADPVDLVFGSEVFALHYKYSSGLILASLELVQDSDLFVDSMPEILGERVGRILNVHLTTGDGAAKPEGFLPNCTSALAAASATAVTREELNALETALDPAYRQRATWMFNATTELALRDLAGTDTRLEWKPAEGDGRPSRLNGYPVRINNDMPDMTTGLRAIAFGDFSRFAINLVDGLGLKRLDERFADRHQVAFVSLARANSRLLTPEAIQCITML